MANKINSEYSFYMCEVDARGVVVANTTKNLEVDFVGLRYSRATGINTIGKPRVYTETYADSDRLRVYVPEDLTNEATTIEFTFYFFGETRQSCYDAFNEYIRHGRHRYWDTARNKYFDFIVTKEIKVSDELWYGDVPYFQVKYTVQNLNGKTFDVDFDY